MKTGSIPGVLPLALAAASTLSLLLAGCDTSVPESQAAEVSFTAGRVVTVQAVTVPSVLEAAGVAEPYETATMSTKLMGAVTEVRVREGELVEAGQVLLQVDARELTAKRLQVEAGVAEARAVLEEARTHAQRMRSLYREQAAPRAQLDQAETGLARAEAGLRAAEAGAAELEAVTAYAVLRAPFGGVIVQRFVDPGAFVAPGAPLLTVQNARRLRISVTTAPEAVRGLAPGTEVDAAIEGRPARAVVEGVVPVGSGSVYTVNAVVDNASGEHLSGSAASLSIPRGHRKAVLVPMAAIRREGDLTGVTVRLETGDQLRWVRLGDVHGEEVEVLSGLQDGERVVVPETMVRGS